MMKNRRVFGIIILAFLNLAALQYISGLSGDMGVYIGTGIFSFMPESLIVFGANIYLLKRFFRREILENRRRVVLASGFGFVLGFACVWGQEVLYHVTLFNSSAELLRAFLCAVGISFFTIPLTSELIGLCDFFSDKTEEEGEIPSLKKKVYCFIGVQIITFISFLPFFLYVWPINFFGDAYDELCYQLNGVRHTHHTVIYGFLLRAFYNIGLNHNSPAFGMQFLALMQIFSLSIAIANFSLYLYEKKVKKEVRILFLLISVLNPVNAYFASTAEKGTMGIALAFTGLVCLLRILDFEKNGAGKTAKTVNAVVFVLATSLGCLFRNNMAYAYLAAGIVIVILRKGWKKKFFMFALFFLVISLFKFENHLLMTLEHSEDIDKYIETFPYPIMCLSRIAILHEDELPKEFYQEILQYIPQSHLEEYSISNADSIKAYMNEDILQKGIVTFLKLFVKGAFMYPEDYLDQLAWLTYGYWDPYHAFVLIGTTPVIDKELPEEFEKIEHRNYLSRCDFFIKWLYSENGRFKMPIFSWFYRGAIYTWSVFFLFCYGIYKKSPRKISICMVPLFYLGTIFLGPLCLYRYLYFNILTFPLILYLLIEKDEWRTNTNI